MAVFTVLPVSFVKFFGEQLNRNNQERLYRHKKPTHVVQEDQSLAHPSGEGMFIKA